MKSLRLVLHQFRYDLKALVRNPQSRAFTIALPLIFLWLFVSVLANGDVRLPDGKVSQATYFVPHIAVFGIVGATLVNLMVSVVTQRETGVLKRRRSTPVPAGVVIAARMLTSIVVALAIVALVLAISAFAYDVHVRSSAWPAMVIAVVLGSVTFCALAYAISTFVGSSDAAMAVGQLVSLPLYFVSGIFFPENSIPEWLRNVSDVFPVRRLAEALQAPFDPHSSGMAFEWTALAIVAAWGIVAFGVAAARFSWYPREDR